jgi:hypothetical protein
LVLSPTSSINLGFTTEGRLAVVLIITFSWGFQLGGYIYLYNSYINTAPPTSFLAPLPGLKKKKIPRQLRASKTSTSFLAPLLKRKKISARGVSRFQSFTLLLFCFILFLLASFYQKYKKISSFIVVIFTCLLFSLARMSNPEVEVRTFKQQVGESLKDAWY